MRKSAAGFSVLLTALLLSGCYHAVIETGSAPGTQNIDIAWAHGFLFGLVPPATVNASAQCPSGVARVETKQSFLNGLASALTWGLYSPMHITVTCASSRQSAALPLARDRAAAQALLESGQAFLLPLRAEALGDVGTPIQAP